MTLPARRHDNDRGILIEKARLLWPNFAGEKQRYNAEGDRNFNVVIPPDQVQSMIEAGWKIRALNAREGEEPEYILKVKVNFNGRTPPRLNLITSKNRTPLTEDLVGLLDELELDWVDVRIRAHDWDYDGRQGRTAYLVNLFAKMYEDELDLRYQHLQDTSQTPELPAGDSTDARAALPSSEDDYVDAEIVSDSGWNNYKELAA